MKIIITINYLSGTISKAFMIPSYMHIVVIEENNLYIISIADRENNIKETLFEIEKDKVDKKKAFEIERHGGDRSSNWVNYIKRKE